jgi:hypothetical protein
LFPDCNRLPWRVKFVPGFTAEASLISYKPDSKVIGVGVGPGIALLPPPHPDRTRQIIPVNTNIRPERLIIRLLDGSFSGWTVKEVLRSGYISYCQTIKIGR